MKEATIIRFVKNYFNHCIEFNSAPTAETTHIRTDNKMVQMLYYKPNDLNKGTYKKLKASPEKSIFIACTGPSIESVLFSTQNEDKEAVFCMYEAISDYLE